MTAFVLAFLVLFGIALVVVQVTGLKVQLTMRPFVDEAIGGAVMFVAGWVLGERFDGMPTLKGTLAVAYLASFGSIVAFSAYMWLLHNVRPALAGSYAYVNPVIAVMLGAWLAAERFTSHDLGAMGVILLGVVAITLAKARAPKAVASQVTTKPTADETA